MLSADMRVASDVVRATGLCMLYFDTPVTSTGQQTEFACGSHARQRFDRLVQCIYAPALDPVHSCR
jgi:hypothetical protein